QMLAICNAMASLASMGSPYARGLVELCRRSCTACAKECEVHAGHHRECAACFEACQEALQALAALA
ncbi:MAG: hypothetical protein MK135_09915, partial [Polyangiaceae bacterium]|nr:hypothetical protein [Polyangiaceae bacterium]